MSWVYRKDLLKCLDLRHSTDGSFILALEIFLHSKVYYLNVNTCVHYVHSGSVAHQTDYKKIFEYDKGVHNIQTYYASKYKVEDSNNQLDWFYQKYAKYLIARNEKEEFKNIITCLNNKKEKSKKEFLLSYLLKNRITTYFLHIWLKYNYIKKGQL